MQVRGFYGVVDLVASPDAAQRARHLAEDLLAGGAALVQVRMKRTSARTLLGVALAVREVTAAAGIPMVVNDRLDVALAAGADGVHLGQDDLPLAGALAALAAYGRRIMVGISTHTPAQAAAAAAGGADYLGFGPVFATVTKDNPDPVQGLDGLEAAVAAAGGVPIVAIGGITPERAPAVAAAGAAAACVISAVNAAPGGRAGVVAAARRVAAAFAGTRA